LKRLVVLDAAQHAHPRRTESHGGLLDVLGGQLFDDQVRREVAADGDHRVGQLSVRHAAAAALVDGGVRVVAHIQREGAAVDDAVELVDDGDLVVERERAGARLAEELDEDRDFHRAAAWYSTSGWMSSSSPPSSVR
jgi:hypothetical protein